MNILNFSFWFDVFPLPFMPVIFWSLIGVLAAAVLLAIAGLIIRRKKMSDLLLKRVWSKLIHWGFSFGLIGLFLAFLKQERVPYLGMRLWLAIWLLACFIWLAFVLKYIFLDVPKMRKEKQERDQLLKYIP